MSLHHAFCQRLVMDLLLQIEKDEFDAGCCGLEHIPEGRVFAAGFAFSILGLRSSDFEVVWHATIVTSDVLFCKEKEFYGRLYW